MTFREFEDAMFLRGYRVVREHNYIKALEGQDIIVTISDTKKFCYALTMAFYELTDEHQAKLYELISKYVATPIRERHNQQKYYIAIKHHKFDSKRKYLNIKADGTITFNNKNDSERYKTQFTELEIIEYDLLPFVQNPLFERIEVGAEGC